MPYSIKKRIHGKNLYLLCIVICFFFAFLAEAQNAQVSFTKEEKKWIVEHPTIRLGVGIAFKPFMWVEEEDGQPKFKGMVSDYIELLEKQLGVDMQVVFNIPFNEALARGRTGQIDLFPCVSSTPERLEYLSFTESYLSYPLVVITREDAPIIGDLKDLEGKRIATVEHLFVYSKLKTEYPHLNLDYVFTKKVEENIEEISLGRADACIINLAAASFYIQKKGITNLKIAAPVNWEGIQLRMGVRKDWPILQGIIEKGLAAISREKKDQISQKWIRAKYEPGVAVDLILKWSLGIGMCVLVILVLIITWNRQLKKEIAERKKVQTALKESEIRFSEMFEHMSSGVAVYEPIEKGEDYIFKAFNAAAEKITRIQRKDILGKKLLEVFPKMDKTGFLNTLQEVWKSGKEIHLAPFYYKDNVRAGWRENRVYKLPSGEVVALFDDVTLKMESELKIKKSEKKYQTLFENMAQGVFYQRADGVLIDYNKAALEMFGLTSDQFIGKTSIDPQWNVISEDGTILTGDKHPSMVALQTKKPVKDAIVGVYNFRKKSYTWLLVNAIPEFNKAGTKPYQVFVTLQDITERKQAEAMLHQSSQLLEASQSIAKVGGWELDLATNNLFWTAETYRIHDTSPSEFKPSVDAGVSYFLPKSRCIISEALQAAITRGKGYDLILETLTTKGRRIDVRTTCKVTHHEGRPAKLTGIFQDITELKKVEEEKKHLQTQLHQAQKMESIGNLAGGIAHDFNNILSSIIGFTELSLDSVEKGTDLEDDLQEVRTAGMRAKDLVKQILTFARQSDEAVKPVQVNIIAKEVLKFIKSSIPSTIQINDKIISNSIVMGSPTQIHQVLMNLCTNAADSMEEGGILEISLNDVTIDKMAIPDLKPGEYIEINVSDTGMGISPQHIHTIFEPYFTTKSVGEGTGMGLAVVHGIVEKYGGKIKVDSTTGKGSCFTIYLPITKKRNVHNHFEKEDLPLGTENILFVDDEDPIAKMGSKVLEQLGYSVTTRTSSVEALELFRLKPQAFDLVISDMTMPNMTGDKMAAEMMKIRSDIPVVLCTGYSKKISEESAAKFGIKAFAYKPIAKYDLAKTVRKVLDEANYNITNL